jgi:hypothetical protein
MKNTLTFPTFADAFRSHGRSDQFSYSALKSLFNHFEELEDSTGEALKLDVIDICCEYSEESPESIADSYSVDIEGLDEDEVRDAVVSYLERRTSVVADDCDGRIVYCTWF